MAHKSFLTVSFSGAGHLLPYHLGVASVLLSSSQKIPPMRAVSGSSSGAIAAVLVARLPHRLHDYTESFIEARGKAVQLLQELLYEEELVEPKKKVQVVQVNSPPSLHIAATRCRDGSLELFDFEPPKKLFHSLLSNSNQHDQLIQCVRASCAIPSSFHPIDVLERTVDVQYPEEQGVEINGDFFVDGGIAGPAPPTPLDSNVNASRVVVSPISGCSSTFARRISPLDTTVAVGRSLSCKGGFTVRPSLQNLRVFVASAGSVSSPLLREWYERGAGDAERVVEDWKYV